LLILRWPMLTYGAHRQVFCLNALQGIYWFWVSCTAVKAHYEMLRLNAPTERLHSPRSALRVPGHLLILRQALRGIQGHSSCVLMPFRAFVDSERIYGWLDGRRWWVLMPFRAFVDSEEEYFDTIVSGSKTVLMPLRSGRTCRGVPSGFRAFIDSEWQ